MTNTESSEHRFRLAAGWRVLIVSAAILALIAGIFAMVAATHGPARSEPSRAIATADVGGRSLAVVVYETDTFGHLDLFRASSMGFSTQAEAFDLDTGERVWDTLLFAEFGGTDARVLGMGSKYVYVTTAKGMLILDAATGDIVAREDKIAGLADDYIASLDAYAWDVETAAVVLLTASGTVLSIPRDSLTAEPATSPQSQRWASELNLGDSLGSVFSPESWDQVDSRATAPSGDRADPAWATDGWRVEVLLADGSEWAAGSAEGFAVTQTYQPTTSEAYYLFQVGDLATENLIGTVEGEGGAAAVTVSANGHVVLLSHNDSQQGLLIVASADGIRSSVIGERGFFGW